jgi:CO dehydrogenase/acetyl-CoA synthase gamma subunit (corrinoid Fe-S protein)
MINKSNFTAMKKIVTLLITALFPLLAFTQNSAIDKVFSKYGDREGFTVVTINKGLLKMVANVDDDRESKEFLSRISQIKILAVEEENSGINLYDEVLSSLDKSEYEELMTAKSKGEEVLLLIRKNGDIIEELIVLVGGDDENALVYISGKMNMKDLGKLSSSVNIEGAGLDHLNDIEK